MILISGENKKDIRWMPKGTKRNWEFEDDDLRSLYIMILYCEFNHQVSKYRISLKDPHSDVHHPTYHCNECMKYYNPHYFTHTQSWNYAYMQPQESMVKSEYAGFRH